MGEFKFKRFSVKNERSAMKVNTDGVLLGAWMPLTGSERRLLDVGTGTGVIALMAAQRLEMIASASPRTFSCHCEEDVCNDGGVFIHAIDIDEVSVEEARDNFNASPWAGMLRAECISLQQLASVMERGCAEGDCFADARNDRKEDCFAGDCDDGLKGNDTSDVSSTTLSCHCEEVRRTDVAIVPADDCGGADACGYDLIFSNPPYFINSLKAPEGRRAAARDNATLSHQELIDCACRLLAPGGHLALILPTEEAELFLDAAAARGLLPNAICKVCTRKGLPPKRYMMDLSFTKTIATPASQARNDREDDCFADARNDREGDCFAGARNDGVKGNDTSDVSSTTLSCHCEEVRRTDVAIVPAEDCLGKPHTGVNVLCIQEAETKSDYTEEYKSLTRNFYIKF